MLLATTQVEDVDRFMEVFSTKGAEKRKQHGSKGAVVFRDPSESDRVWVIFDWDEQGWQSFVSDPDVPPILAAGRAQGEAAGRAARRQLRRLRRRACGAAPVRVPPRRGAAALARAAVPRLVAFFRNCFTSSLSVARAAGGGSAVASCRRTDYESHMPTQGREGPMGTETARVARRWWSPTARGSRISPPPNGRHAARPRAARCLAGRTASGRRPGAPGSCGGARGAGQVAGAELVPIRYGRMLVSPFTFFRGAAAIMAADLADGPRTGLQAQLCGDAHLSNFGIFAAPDRGLTFDVNDFDETLPGPFEWDLKRLVRASPSPVASAASPARCGRGCAP